MSSFPNLLCEGRIGSMTVRKRLVMSPMVETMYGTPDGLPSQRTRDYFAARATDEALAPPAVSDNPRRN